MLSLEVKLEKLGDLGCVFLYFGSGFCVVVLVFIAICSLL